MMKKKILLVLSFVLLFCLTFNDSSAQKQGYGKPKDRILIDPAVNCSGLCNTPWIITQNEAVVWLDTNVDCVVEVTTRSRICQDQGSGTWTREVEIIRVEPEELNNCNNSIPEIMEAAIKYTLFDIRYIFNDTTLVSFDVYLRTSKCWYIDSADNNALKSCDTTKCYQSKFKLFYLDTNIYVVDHQTEGNDEQNPCGSYLLCQDVISSHDIPDGPLFSGGPPPGPYCPEECYWTIKGNTNTGIYNTLGSTLNWNEEPLIIKAGDLECMRLMHRDWDWLSVGIGIGMFTSPRAIKPLGMLDINIGLNQGKISFDKGSNDYNPTIKIYRPLTESFNDDDRIISKSWWIENSGDELKFKTGPAAIKGEESVSSVFTINKDGRICAKDMYVQISGTPCWGDYVFDDKYNLKSLDELENFINENKHLPDIPSANEVVNNGIQLGEMQGKLLRKLEELTLYVIQLKKDNESLKGRINKLENKKAGKK